LTWRALLPSALAVAGRCRFVGGELLVDGLDDVAAALQLGVLDTERVGVDPPRVDAGPLAGGRGTLDRLGSAVAPIVRAVIVPLAFPTGTLLAPA
jgi:hypothetical protein